MEPFLCGYCAAKAVDLESMVQHLISLHTDKTLKYRVLVLDSTTGTFGYQAKLHKGIIPSELEVSNKTVVVNENRIIIQRNEKRKKLNTPIKPSIVRRGLFGSDPFVDMEPQSEEVHNTENETYISTAAEEEISEFMPLRDDGFEEQLINLMPSVVETLKDSGHIESFVKFCNLLGNKDFPLDNICFLLFLDVVHWFSSETSAEMRFKFPETVKFWQIGHRLFHGKFLRFMSGLRNTGNILDGSSERGRIEPLNSQINFAVPSRQNLYSNSDETLQAAFPGINRLAINNLSKYSNGKYLKIGVDGKKIARGKGLKMGDVDCWGFEAKPTLEERKQQLSDEITEIENAISSFEEIKMKNIHKLEILPTTTATEKVESLKVIVRIIGNRNKSLRVTEQSLKLSEEKFQRMGGSDWKNSRFYPVISSIRMSRIDVKKQIEDSLKLTNDIAEVGATLNRSDHLFRSASDVSLDEQKNFFKLSPGYQGDETQFIQQKTERWFAIREKSMVTGSTCNTAIGLNKLKNQQEHYDKFIMKKGIREVAEHVQKRMDYGSKHEIDAIGTLTSKVLPFMYPELSYYEEGCLNIPTDRTPSFITVSPDGSLRSAQEQIPRFMYENKCKAPDSYYSHPFYQVPAYYVLQLLCEMKAYNCPELIFTSWTEQSMTVFLARFCNELWEECFQELCLLYDVPQPKRPTRVSAFAKNLKQSVADFVKNNTVLLGEFPSMTTRQMSQPEDEISGMSAYIYPKRTGVADRNSRKNVQDAIDVLFATKSWIQRTYHLLRNVASEILVFMANDLDRSFNSELNNAHPLAYAMKGPSMSVEVLRNMMNHLIDECESNGIQIVATASDGQWHGYSIRDKTGNPLTVHQLARDHYTSTKNIEISSLKAKVKSTYVVKSLEDVRYEKLPGQPLHILGHKTDAPMVLRRKPNVKKNTAQLNETEAQANTADQHNAIIHGFVGEAFNQMDETDQIVIDEAIISMDSKSVQQRPPDSDRSDMLFSPLSSNETELSLTDWLFQEDMEYTTNSGQTLNQTNNMQDIMVTSSRQQMTSNSLPQDELLETTTNELIEDTALFEANRCTAIDRQESLNQRECMPLENVDAYERDTTDFLNDAFSVLFGDEHVPLICVTANTNESSTAVSDDYMQVDQPGYVQMRNTSATNSPESIRVDQPRIIQESVTGTTLIDETIGVDQPTMFFQNSTASSSVSEEPIDVAAHKHNELNDIELNGPINLSDLAEMLLKLQKDSLACTYHDWSKMSTNCFKSLFTSKTRLNKSLRKYELLLCLNSIRTRIPPSEMEKLSSLNKDKIVQFVINNRSNELSMQNAYPRIRNFSCKKVPSLRHICFRVVDSFDKESLNAVVAEMTWDNTLLKWKNDVRMPTHLQVGSKDHKINWFSRPSVDETGNVRFHFTDACHILTCIRTKLCTTGIKGIRRKAWELAALVSDSRLNIAVVTDCLDKQSVPLARRLFAKEVQNNMLDEYMAEKEFCQLIREWFDAEDEPTISAGKRFEARMALRDWLLKGYKFGEFPPHTQYVRGIPIVTYEALVVNIERKLQMYAVCPGYNARALGSQEVEQFFSTFRDMDPTRFGTPKPDAIPNMMAAATEVDNCRLNQER